MTKIIDIHAHILPGVDDGAHDWAECRDMLLESSRCGVTAVIATPHFLPWKKKYTGTEICELCYKIKQKFYEETTIPMDIYPGNELYYHTDLIESLKKGDALTLAGSRYVLVEFSTEESYKVLCSAVHNLRIAGYIPVIAHIERYGCMRKTGRMEELHKLGALFQMNAEVLQYGFFNETGRWAKKALMEEQIHFLSSDMHNLTDRPPLKEEQLAWITRKLDEEYQSGILYRNSSKILN